MWNIKSIIIIVIIIIIIIIIIMLLFSSLMPCIQFNSMHHAERPGSGYYLSM